MASYLDMSQPSYNVGADTTATTNQAQTMQTQINANQNAFNANAADSAASAAYPSFANSYGIGSQNPFGTPTTDPAAAAVAPVNQQGTGGAASPATSSSDGDPTNVNRGFNPWSMVGEANVR